MFKLIKKFLGLRKQKRLAHYKRMDSEIRCAIAYDVMKRQTKEEVKIPAFEIINQRYNELGIDTPKDLTRTYTRFYLEGLVSGVEL
jgi:ferritin-like protein